MKRLKNKIINWLFDGTVTLNPGSRIEYTDRSVDSESRLEETGCEEKNYDTSHETYALAKKNSDSGKIIIDAITSICSHEDIQRRDALDKQAIVKEAELKHWFYTMKERLVTNTNYFYNMDCRNIDVRHEKFRISVSTFIRDLKELKETYKFFNIPEEFTHLDWGISKIYSLSRDFDKLDITRLVETLEKRFSDEINENESNEPEEGEC